MTFETQRLAHSAGQSRHRRRRAARVHHPDSPLPHPPISSLPVTVSSSQRPSTRLSPVCVATRRRLDSWRMPRQICHNLHTSTTCQHSKQTTDCRPFQTSSQSPSARVEIPTTTAALATLRIRTCSHPCHRQASLHSSSNHPLPQDPVSTSLPRKLCSRCREGVRICSRV